MPTIERKWTAKARVAVAGAAFSALAACTLVSGWGDLQGGTRAAGDASAPDARSSSSSGSVGDAATTRDAAPRTSCAAQCAPQVCCMDIVTRQTSCAAACGTSNTSWELDCASAADCQGGQCCLDIASGRFVAACAPTCPAGSEIVCDPNDPNSCPSPKVCNGGQLGTAICQ